MELALHRNAESFAARSRPIPAQNGRDGPHPRRITVTGAAMPRENPSCTITTSLGNFTAEIFLRQVPLTAANFIDLVERRFYDGTHVHLLAPKMVLGMGCPHSCLLYTSDAADE